ncbi:MAG: hypothetical protein ABR548_10020 [Actinomycetota bacterium]|nr:zinc ribbon domain-containing protein [Actinomycetota bacterium]
MKIEGRCRNCGRDFPIDLVLSPPEAAGRCPFCGKSLDPEYSALLVEALGKLQAIGSQMESILDRARAVGENLEINADTIVAPIRDALGAREEASASRRATREAAQAEQTGVR